MNRSFLPVPLAVLLAASLGLAPTDAAKNAPVSAPANPPASAPTSADSAASQTPHSAADAAETGNRGGEPDGIVQVANLVYAGTKSSRCFSDHFLILAERESAMSTSRRFHAVKLGSPTIFEFPLLIMTGEGEFRLSDAERENLRDYVGRGGLLLASAGCSSTEWNRAFRREMAAVFPDNPLLAIGMDHPLFHTVYRIERLQARHGTARPLLGISIGGRLGVVYSQDGLNDTANTTGCCCCGGNELTNAAQINVNILAYTMTF